MLEHDNLLNSYWPITVSVISVQQTIAMTVAMEAALIMDPRGAIKQFLN